MMGMSGNNMILTNIKDVFCFSYLFFCPPKLFLPIYILLPSHTLFWMVSIYRGKGEKNLFSHIIFVYVVLKL